VISVSINVSIVVANEFVEWAEARRGGVGGGRSGREMHTQWCKGDVELITLWNDIIPSSTGLPPTHQQNNTKSIPLVLRGKK